MNIKLEKYGFHGTSHKYIAEFMKNSLNKDDVNLIILVMMEMEHQFQLPAWKMLWYIHGITPLSGVMMGTRSGDVEDHHYYLYYEKTW